MSIIMQDALTIKTEILHIIANERPPEFAGRVWKFNGFKIALRPHAYGFLLLQVWPKGYGGPTQTLTVAERWSEQRWTETGQTTNIKTWLNENGVESNIPFDGEPVDCADEYGLEAAA